MDDEDPVFPAEIFALIIDVLGSELAPHTSVDDDYWDLRRTLCSLSLTCQAFRERSTRHLFHTLVLWGEPNGPYDRYTERFRTLAKALVENEGPAQHVQKVSITLFSGLGYALDGELAVEGEEPPTEEEALTTPWITFMQEVIPDILAPLSNVQSLLLSSNIPSVPLMFSLLARPTRAAILSCMRSNPIESIVIQQIHIPWQLLLALPPSLESLELGDPEHPITLDVGVFHAYHSEGSDDYLADLAMFGSKSEPPLAISPKVLRPNLSPMFSHILGRQGAKLFRQLEVLDLSANCLLELDCHDVMLSRASPTLRELIIRIDRVQDAGESCYDIL
jgi:hypothetical protein